MGTRTSKVAEHEKERQEQVAELNEEGTDWSERNKPGSLGCHELLDRTFIASQMVEQYVLSHPACVRNREWYALANKAMTALLELYQRVGAEHLDDPATEVHKVGG